MKYEIAEPFEGIQDYENYKLPKLFFHGRMIDKSFVDNWQYSFIKNNIKNKSLVKGSLTNGYNLYDVKMSMNYDFGYTSTCKPRRITAKSAEEAEKIAIRLVSSYYKYSFKKEKCDWYDEISGTTLKISVVKINAD